MENTGSEKFEALWKRAQLEPETEEVVAENSIVLDLSIENVLDRYTSFVRQAADENKVSESTYQALLERTAQYKKSLEDIDGGSLLKEIRNLGKIIHSLKQPS